MSEFYFSPVQQITKNTNLCHLLLSGVFLLCSFSFYHPLYFGYFIFFLPYFLKILSFLSPLFITTSLLLLSLFFTLCHDNALPEQQDLSYLLTHFHKLRSRLSWHEIDDSLRVEDFEAYKIVFEASILEIGENPDVDSMNLAKMHCSRTITILEESKTEIGGDLDDVPKIINPEHVLRRRKASIDECTRYQSFDSINSQILITENDVNPVDSTTTPEITGLTVGEQRVEDKNGVTFGGGEEREKEVKQLIAMFDKAGEQKEEISKRNGSNAIKSKVGLDHHHENTQIPRSLSNLGSFGSIRREKEWRRTLACKIFEERHNANNKNGVTDDAMDSLWETYETETEQTVKNRAKKEMKNRKDSIDNKKDFDFEEEEEEGSDGNVQLCCLQALKFSTGKMNLGMGRPNLVKFSKALKGFGWLHHLSKNGKKKRTIN